MTRFTTDIKKSNKSKESKFDISIAILSAGCGKRIKSYEPRSLLKINGDTLINHQIKTLNQVFECPEIITVVGCHANKVIKKINKKTRIIENQLYAESNSSESIRLALNNTLSENFMFLHGDLLFNKNCLKVSYDHSFIIIDNKENIKENEVGVTTIDEELSVLSYGLSTKWAQIAYFTNKEYQLLQSLFCKHEEKDKKKLSFEILNSVVEMGGSFKCYEPRNMKIKEIDRIGDIK